MLFEDDQVGYSVGGTLAMQGAGYLPNVNTKTSETAVVLRGEMGTGE